MLTILNPIYPYPNLLGDAVEVLLNHCLAMVVNWLKVNKLKLNPAKTEAMLVVKAVALKDIVLPFFNGAQLTLSASVKSLRVILEKQVNAFFLGGGRPSSNSA